MGGRRRVGDDVRGMDGEIYTFKYCTACQGETKLVRLFLVSFAVKHRPPQIDEPASLILHFSCSLSIYIKTSMLQQ